MSKADQFKNLHISNSSKDAAHAVLSGDVVASSTVASASSPESDVIVLKRDEYEKIIKQSDRPEPRTKRIQVLLTPSLHATIKNQAGDHRVSVNEYIFQLLLEGTGRNAS